MTKTSRAMELSSALSSRYGLKALDCEGWGGIELFGGMGMDAPTFNALANAAMVRGDTQATIYELESTEVEFPAISIRLDFSSFNALKGSVISHFEVAMVPPSKAWAALLTVDLQTFVYGPPGFLSDVAAKASASDD